MLRGERGQVDSRIKVWDERGCIERMALLVGNPMLTYVQHLSLVNRAWAAKDLIVTIPQTHLFITHYPPRVIHWKQQPSNYTHTCLEEAKKIRNSEYSNAKLKNHDSKINKRVILSQAKGKELAEVTPH